MVDWNIFSTYFNGHTHGLQTTIAEPNTVNIQLICILMIYIIFSGNMLATHEHVIYLEFSSIAR